MKILVLPTLFISTFIGFEKDNDSIQKIDKEYLIGKWVNTIIETDTLFWNDTIMLRTDTITSTPKHSYSYELFEDSIRFEYNGEYYILAPKSTHKLSFDNEKSIITIEGFEEYFPEYSGNQFSRK